jgi:hypothetical protein
MFAGGCLCLLAPFRGRVRSVISDEFGALGLRLRVSLLHIAFASLPVVADEFRKGFAKGQSVLSSTAVSAWRRFAIVIFAIRPPLSRLSFSGRLFQHFGAWPPRLVLSIATRTSTLALWCIRL